MAKAAEVTEVNQFLTSFKLPGGVTICARKPTNRVRRVLMEAPDERANNLFEAIAAACVASISFPEGYSEDFPQETSREYAADDLATPWKRFDDLLLMDTQAFVSSFELLNLPTKAMVESIVDEIKKRKAQGK